MIGGMNATILPPAITSGAVEHLFQLVGILADPDRTRKVLAEIIEVREQALAAQRALGDLQLREKRLNKQSRNSRRSAPLI
jgi:hypothetical protein